jgi:hypothetical protein
VKSLHGCPTSARIDNLLGFPHHHHRSIVNRMAVAVGERTMPSSSVTVKQNGAPLLSVLASSGWPSNRAEKVYPRRAHNLSAPRTVCHQR